MKHLDETHARRFARLALDCVRREYPNKIAHAMTSDQDVAPPRLLTPAFYGCFDWHSAVHGHWLLARVARMFPGTDFAAEARAALAENIAPARIEREVEYLKARPGFERPYGLAWLIALAAELRRSEIPPTGVLDPLEEVAKAEIARWLPKLPRPDRSGQHPNTAFSMGLMLDAARESRDIAFADLLVSRARDFYLSDRDAPLAYEPAGEDFLSASLSEADLMRRVLGQDAFATWLDAFLPDVSTLQPVTSPDRSDGRLAHLDGLNLSRAWMLSRVAQWLPEGTPKRQIWMDLSDHHAEAGLASVTGEHYEGGHWLATFAVYLLTQTEPETVP